MISFLKKFWWAIILPLILAPLLWNIVKPKDIWGDFTVVDLRIPNNFNFKSTQFEDIQLMHFRIYNNKEEDIYLKYLEINYIINFKGINFKLPLAHETAYKQLPYKIIFSQGSLKINGNITIPASDSVSIYIWAQQISKIPNLICSTNKGKIDITQQIVIDDKIKYIVYDNVYVILFIFIAIMVVIVVGLKKDNHEKGK